MIVPPSACDALASGPHLLSGGFTNFAILNHNLSLSPILSTPDPIFLFHFCLLAYVLLRDLP